MQYSFMQTIYFSFAIEYARILNLLSPYPTSPFFIFEFCLFVFAAKVLSVNSRSFKHFSPAQLRQCKKRYLCGRRVKRWPILSGNGLVLLRRTGEGRGEGGGGGGGGEWVKF